MNKQSLNTADKNPEIETPNAPQRGGPMRGGPMGGGAKAKDFKKSIIKLIKSLKPYALWVLIALVFTAGGTVCAQRDNGWAAIPRSLGRGL